MAGTARGVTAIQLDVKLAQGVPLAVMEAALDAATAGRLKILGFMDGVMSSPRPSLKPSAPRAEILRFDPERLRHLVGPGGEMRKYIESTFECEVDTQTEGVAYIYGSSERNVLEARMLVQDLVTDITEGAVYRAEVLEVREFGALVKLTRAQEALLHLSELTHDPLLAKRPLVELLAVGQTIDVKVCEDVSLPVGISLVYVSVSVIAAGAPCGPRHGAGEGVSQGAAGQERRYSGCPPGDQAPGRR